MKFSDHVLVAQSNFRLLSALLSAGLLVVGCVSLTKPSEVQKCSTSPRGCSNDPNQPTSGDDAREDAVYNPSPDQAPGGDTPMVNPDAGPDVPSTDSPIDQGDSATDAAKDVNVGDVRDSSVVLDTGTPAIDGPADKVPGVEPGPEPPGAEPSSGPEPGPEPGLEPGPEPGLEPGPEPAPEPPQDGGLADGPGAACANATPVAANSSGYGNTGNFNTLGTFCFVTCDTIPNWGCDSFTNTVRTVTVNGTAVTCGSALPAKKSGYYYFAIGAGSASQAHTWDAIHWSGTAATSCPAPAGGFSP